MVKIEGIVKGGIAEQEGVSKGDRVISVNGKPVEDLIDLHVLTSRSRCRITVINRLNKEYSFYYREREGPLGIIPEPVRVKKCRNKCVFCFVHQLPRGLRKSLYIKDEDYRLSFLSGNFITLSDITDDELRKITGYRLSPVYVSIHTTDNELRRVMLGNPEARDILPLLERLVKRGITVHGQIVLCPGINDGKYFEKTMEDLSRLYPGLRTVSVVPVGITSHRKGLPLIKKVTPQMAVEVVELVERFARKWRKGTGEDLFFASDEFYLMSVKNLPSSKRYGEFPQIENGVGIVRSFLNGRKRFLRMNTTQLKGLSGTVVTGLLAEEYVRDFMDEYNRKTGSKIGVLPIENTLFGNTVTVTGLLPGKDVIESSKRLSGDFLFVPSVMLREAGDRFLDDLKPEHIEERTGKKVVIFLPRPVEFYGKCLEIKSY